jgi:hypothetical protein
MLHLVRSAQQKEGILLHLPVLHNFPTCAAEKWLSLSPASVGLQLALLPTLRMDAVCYSETSRFLCTIWRYNPEPFSYKLTRENLRLFGI